MKKERITEFFLLGGIIYFIFFLRLGSFWIRPWDEAIYAVNAYEMLKKGSYIVPYFDNIPDLLNTKPPLLSWFHIFFIKILGFNEVSVRLPSALSGALASIFLFQFLRKRFSDTCAWSSFLVVVTSFGFVTYHTSRTGEMDATLTLFLFLNNIFLFRFLTEEKNENKNIFFYWLFLSLAFLTKSFAALLFLPAHFILVLINKKIRPLFVSHSFYAGSVLFLVLSFGFIFLREHLQPGYLAAMIKNDFLKISEAKDLHGEPFDFYFNNLFYSRFSLWVPLFSFGVISLFFEKDEKIRKICFAAFFSALTYLSIISSFSTKLSWYDMPVFPLLAIIAGYSCVKIFEFLRINNFSKLKQTGIIVACFSIPIYYAIKNSHDQPISSSEKQYELMAIYIYEKEKDGFNFDGWKTINKSHQQLLLFYKYKLSEKNQIISFTNEHSLDAGERVFLKDEEAKKLIEKNYSYRIVDSLKEVKAYEILEKRNLRETMENITQ